MTSLPRNAAAAAGSEAPPDAIVVGRVVGAWGVHGWLRVTPFNDPRESVLLEQRRWWLRSEGRVRALDIEQVRIHGDALLARVHGVEVRESAQALAGAELLVGRSAFPTALADEVYWVDLIGCTVRNPAGETLGVVQAIDEFGADPVLRLDAGSGAAPRLIPLVSRHILAIDLADRSILAEWALDD